MNIKVEAYILKPAFFPLGKCTTNREVISLIKGAIAPDIIEEFFEKSGSSLRFLDFDPVSIFSTAATAIDIALEENSLARSDLDGIIYASMFKDNYEPSTAASVALELRLPRLKALDVTAACSGMAHAVEVAVGWLTTNPDLNNIALVSVDLPFKYIDWEINDSIELKIKGSGLTVGAAASALIITRNKPGTGIKISHFFTYDDAQYSTICKLPINGLFFSDSNKLSRPAVKSVIEMNKVLDGIASNTWFIPHQPSVEIARIAKMFKIDSDHIIITHQQYGNTVSSAWISAYYHLCKFRFNEVKQGDPVIRAS